MATGASANLHPLNRPHDDYGSERRPLAGIDRREAVETASARLSHGVHGLERRPSVVMAVRV